MSKIKKLWKALSGAISWNLNGAKITDKIIKSGRKAQQKDTAQGGVKKQLAGS